MFWIIPVVCAGLAIGCAATGALAMLQARNAVAAHAARLNATNLVDPERMERTLAKFSAAAATADAERERVNTAIAAIGAAVQELRLREAVDALRMSVVAVRALAAAFAGR